MKKSKVLMIEDDTNVSKLITDYLTKSGYDVTGFSDGPEALEYVRQRGLPHIALVDLSLPSMHGFELANKLKSMADVPIIFVTSTGDKETIVQGLKKYAEDFIVKPFELRELEARIQVVLARMPSFDYASEPIVRVDDHLNIDFAHNRIVVNGKTVGLTPTESILLHVLLRNAGRVVENRMLIARVWPSEDVFEDTLRVHMHRLRRKLESDSHHPHYIRTERGVGYMFTQRPPDLFGDRA
jgi:DNA-binding response OmpR family regulator